MVTTSVIIPVYNDPDGLTTTIESLLDQSAADYEVIIVDNGSTDRTVSVARDFAKESRVRLTIEENIQGSYAARNAGIQVAQGKVFGFIDADMWVESDYVEEITRRVLDGSDYLGCAVEVVDGTDTLWGSYNAVTGFPIQHYIEQLGFAPTCCLVVHRRVIEDVGPFDERLVSSGDLEFGRRVSDAGYELEYDPEITLYHPARSTFSELSTKHDRLGRGVEQLQKYHPDRFEHPPIYSPLIYAPPHPKRFYHDVRGNGRAMTDYIKWFIGAWLLKFYKAKGRVSERY